MGGFDFGGDADDDRDPPADDGVSFGADGTDGADTVVSPAEPSPLDDPGSLGSTRDSVSDRDRSGERPDDAGGDGTVPTAESDPVEPLLYAGEEVRASLPVADGRLVATSHRVLAHAPQADPEKRATLRAVHRVNVTDVSPSSTATDWLVRPIAYTVIGGLAMVLGGSMVSLDSMSATTPDGAGATGVGGLLSMVDGVLSVLSLVDDALRVAGAVSLLLGVALMGVYAGTRGREVVVETEGEADTLRVDAGGVDDDAIERFRAEAGVGDERTSGTLQRLFGR
ncbi:hypothetical protein [Halobaculum magnesiiphilum]|uniref:Uncharacterized protein n=1 Tax=Halobaculum magnesiiphilum TaxID=1017351 RepID=A0A8T8WBR0_9EURY|nr:hypothetical protein [Halobaculum magnesiiphilum]QZP37183.1 hypothetical protein K6T50_12945 [Halobaculum magnesiiphilum]